MPFQTPPHMMMINVSIVTFRTSDAELRRCLASLDSPLVNKILIIDNSSLPSIARCCNHRPKTEYLPNDNTGYGKAHNLALRRTLDSGVPYHLVLNSDVRFEPALLAELVDFMERNPRTGLLQPLLLNPDGSRQYTARLLPTPLDSFGRRFLPAALTSRRNDRYLLKDIPCDTPFRAPYFQGSFMLLRAEALRRSGLFDERFFMYPEDIDLSRRLFEDGWDTLQYTAASAIHDHRRESYHSARMLKIHISNMIRYFNKWGWIFDSRRRAINRSVRSQIPSRG